MEISKEIPILLSSLVSAMTNVVAECKPAIYEVAHRAMTAIRETYTNPIYLGIIGVGAAITFSNHFIPMYMPFIDSDSRCSAEMSKTDPESGALLNKLTKAVHAHARKMGMNDVDQINVRFGQGPQIYGYRYSIGGPLLLIPREDVENWLTEEGDLTYTAQRTVGHELTHILECHAMWGLAGRVMNIALSLGLAIGMAGLLPTINIPLVSIVIKLVAAKLVFPFIRANIVGFVIGPMDRYFERRADRGAIRYIQDKSEAIKIAKAGQKYFTEKAAKNLTIRKEAIEKGFIYGLWKRLQINRKGENRLDFMHPGYIERSDFFEAEKCDLLSPGKKRPLAVPQ